MKNSNIPICPIEFDESLIKHRAKFSIPGKPFGKQRPRVINIGGFAHAYTPKETVNYENLVKISYIDTVGTFKLEGPIKADIIGIFPVPKSTSKKQRELMLKQSTPHSKKPDCDNMAKCVLDALNNIAYDDDSQVCKLSVSKYYGENPRIDVLLEEIK